MKGLMYKEDFMLTEKEQNILKWVQEGKTNGEIGTILGRSCSTVKFHLSNIMKKLDVSSRTQAVSQAIGDGFLSPPRSAVPTNRSPQTRIGIVGCGKGGESILDIMKDNSSIKVMWVADKDPNAKGFLLAEKHDIPRVSDFNRVLDKEIDVVIDVTGEKTVRDEIKRAKPGKTELIGGVSARMLWQLVKERRQRYDEKQKVLKEHETLYHMGMVMENIHSLKDVSYAIVDYATRLTNTPAGSIGIFDERTEEMELVTSKGFSSDFANEARWEIRKGGLTNDILNHNAPFFIPDLREYHDPNPLLLKEGVRSVLAAPLTVEGKIVGILYVNDFKKRSFRAEDISLFSLLSLYAAMTVERVKSIEEMRFLSITDGLTGLYNQRYFMEQLSREIKRAERKNDKLSLIMFDIDHFKDYNDSYGHLEGNKVLKAISAVLKNSSRETDTVGRFGGEEFCIVAPELNKKEGLMLARRLIKGVAAIPLLNKKVTLSGGVSVYPTDGKNHFKLIEKADSRLYKAKKMGRNRICC